MFFLMYIFFFQAEDGIRDHWVTGVQTCGSSDLLVFQPGKREIEATVSELAGVDAEVFPLHGDLDPSEQRRAFRNYSKPKVVVATNVAQTSITIDDIDAVVDSGRERQIGKAPGRERGESSVVAGTCTKK